MVRFTLNIAMFSAGLLLSLLLTMQSGILSAKPTADTEGPEVSQLRQASAMLYSRNLHGGYTSRCTATIIRRTLSGYYLLTAAHCIKQEEEPYLIFGDDDSTVTMYQAIATFIGIEKDGADYAILFIKSTKNFPVIRLGNSDKVRPRERVMSVGNSADLGLIETEGFVTLPSLNRPLIDRKEAVDWRGYILVDLPVTSGASGSAVYSLHQHAVIGVLVGKIGDTHVAALPINRVRIP